MPLARVLVGALCLLFCGCAAHNLQTIVPKERTDSRIAFLADGLTKRAEVMSRLGDPSAVYEAEHILIYRMDEGLRVVSLRGIDAEDRPRPNEPTRWTQVFHNLVLAFDSTGVLETHRLLRVR
ncbi:MAG: hypothetical protein ABIU54_04765 [Candidatus Eisenbacteria bacterium]